VPVAMAEARAIGSAPTIPAITPIAEAGIAEAGAIAAGMVVAATAAINPWS